MSSRRSRCDQRSSWRWSSTGTYTEDDDVDHNRIHKLTETGRNSRNISKKKNKQPVPAPELERNQSEGLRRSTWTTRNGTPNRVRTRGKEEPEPTEIVIVCGPLTVRTRTMQQPQTETEPGQTQNTTEIKTQPEAEHNKSHHTTRERIHHRATIRGRTNTIKIETQPKASRTKTEPGHKHGQSVAINNRRCTIKRTRAQQSDVANIRWANYGGAKRSEKLVQSFFEKSWTVIAGVSWWCFEGDAHPIELTHRSSSRRNFRRTHFLGATWQTTLNMYKKRASHCSALVKKCEDIELRSFNKLGGHLLNLWNGFYLSTLWQ